MAGGPGREFRQTLLLAVSLQGPLSGLIKSNVCELFWVVFEGKMDASLDCSPGFAENEFYFPNGKWMT